MRRGRDVIERKKKKKLSGDEIERMISLYKCIYIIAKIHASIHATQWNRMPSCKILSDWKGNFVEFLRFNRKL